MTKVPQVNATITEAVDRFAREVHAYQEKGIESLESLVDVIGEEITELIITIANEAGANPLDFAEAIAATVAGNLEMS